MERGDPLSYRFLTTVVPSLPLCRERRGRFTRSSRGLRFLNVFNLSSVVGNRLLAQRGAANANRHALPGWNGARHSRPHTIPRSKWARNSVPAVVRWVKGRHGRVALSARSGLLNVPEFTRFDAQALAIHWPPFARLAAC